MLFKEIIFFLLRIIRNLYTLCSYNAESLNLKQVVPRAYSTGSQTVEAPTWGALLGPLEGGGRVDCMRDIFILNEIWV
jgi:hypothetical protein